MTVNRIPSFSFTEDECEAIENFWNFLRFLDDADCQDLMDAINVDKNDFINAVSNLNGIMEAERWGA